MGCQTNQIQNSATKTIHRFLLRIEADQGPQMRQSLEKKAVMVTGGAGFIGSHLVDQLISMGAREVIVVDNLFTGSPLNLSQAFQRGHVTLYREDAENTAALSYIFDNHEIDVVFNCATKALNYSFINPADAFSTNVNVVLNLLELQRNGRFETLCHLSTSEVYGSAIYEPMDEGHPKLPTTTYAAGKAAADLAVETYVKMFDLDAMILRPFNNFGPRQNHEGPLAGVIPVTSKNILQGNRPKIHGDGLQSRDFIFVLDTVFAILKLYECLPKGESVNISTDNEINILSLIDTISKKLDYKGEIDRLPARKSDVNRHKACNKKIQSLIDFQLTPFPTALEETLKYYEVLFKEVA